MQRLMKKILGKKKKPHHGFSLIEVIIGISVITLVITAAAEVTRSSIKMGSITSNELVAHNLAEEGLEIVRNMRDSNWLRNETWTNGLSAGSYVLTENPITSFGDTAASPPWQLAALDGIETAREPERFQRVIKITYTDLPAAANAQTPATLIGEAEKPQLMNVESKVSYNERRAIKNITLTTQLSDWKQGPI